MAAGTKTVGVSRIKVDPGKWSTPVHRQTAEEEIFFVVGGSGICLLRDSAFEVGPGDCVVHRVRELHTLRAGDEGLDVLAFGTRGQTEAGHLPRAGVSWLGGSWVEAGGGDHPWEREAAAGEPKVPEIGARPASVVHVDEVEGDHDGGSWRLLARTAGAELSGLNWGRLPPGEEGAPPHLHSADEEIFVVLRVRERSSSGPRRSELETVSPMRRSRFERATSSRARPRAGSHTASAQVRAA
jgi:uncharacterized cupin superfamily protein